MFDPKNLYELSDKAHKAMLATIREVGMAYADTAENDPEELIANSDGAGAFVEIEGAVYFREPSAGIAALNSTQLRILAQELDNRNGIGLGSATRSFD